MSEMLDWPAIEWLDRWIDENAPAHLPTILLDAMRCAKCAEEAGEVIAAYIGLTGQNPRKGRTHDLDDVLSELADVCITALCAIQHFTHNTRETQAVVDKRLRRCRARAGEAAQ